MQLDRFTEKAQEAIVTAQQLAERAQSPVLDAEHLLAALVAPDDGVPAETLRRLGVDLPTFRDELAGILARRARMQGGQQSLDPRAKRVIERAQEEARRLGMKVQHVPELRVLHLGGVSTKRIDSRRRLAAEKSALTEMRKRYWSKEAPA